jgi:hypothetical protein
MTVSGFLYQLAGTLTRDNLAMLAGAGIHAFASGQKSAWHREKGVDPSSCEGDGVIAR